MEDLALAQHAVVDVLADEVDGAVDDRSVARVDTPRTECRQAFEGPEVRAQAAAAAGRDHHRRAGNDHVTRVEAAFTIVPEGEGRGLFRQPAVSSRIAELPSR
jgi:hypothetical protein